MTINRYRYFYACAFSMFEKHLVAFVDEMVEHDHAESTVKIYLSCVNDVAKAMHAAGIAASDLDEARAIELVAAMGWIKSRETYARFMMKRFVRQGSVRLCRQKRRRGWKCGWPMKTICGASGD
jgi:integrase/recombinase XerD